MQIRNYKRSDAPTIVRLFYETVHAINSRDYSAEQFHAWAPEVPSVATWHTRMVQRHTLVAEDKGEIAAFAELESDGHVDMFYCHKDAAGRVVSRQLCRAIEQKALELGLSRLFVEASIIARRFLNTAASWFTHSKPYCEAVSS